MAKGEKSAYPSGHGPNDLQCFGPPATKDGQFEGTMICDMGCFTQDGKDTNKYYHAAVVQSKKNNEWFAYFEWGRVGATNPQFQFVVCSSKAQAEDEYASQLHSKNDKRGHWIQHPKLGQILEAKPGKDCYLVRPQATRSTGLPDAKTIKLNEGGRPNAAAPTTKTDAKKTVRKTPAADSQTLDLMRSLNVATVSYTKGSMANDALPTLAAIDEARDICTEATRQIGKIGNNIDDQLKDVEITRLTRMLYSRIPKKKDRNAAADTWLLTQNNIAEWLQNLDAYESALATVDSTDVEADPFDGMDIKMSWLGPKDNNGEFIRHWMPQATNGRHGYGKMTVKNVWSVERRGDPLKLARAQTRLSQEKINSKETPIKQPSHRPDLEGDEAKLFKSSHTTMLFHGTRSVNVSGILRKALLMPKQLVGVVITGAMFGPGLYFADDWMKSAGYTSLSGSIWSGGSGGVHGRGAFMFVADVALGTPHVASGPRGYTAPPSGSHCIFGKAGHSQVQNNEWIIFNADQNRLRYLVEFGTGRY